MSIEAVNQFLTQVNQEPQLQAEVNCAIETENVRQLVTELGAKHGYEFTIEELSSQFPKYQSQLQIQPINDDGELSDDDLEAVAGGIGGFENIKW